MIIDDLLSDGEDESAVAQVVQDALALGLLRDEALTAIVAPCTIAYGHPDPGEFAQVLTGKGRADDRAHVRYQTDPPVIRRQISAQAQTQRRQQARK
jgi:hypothetical protein